MAKSFLNQPGLPIGLRNNNPGNLRPGDNWQGMIGINNNFVVFEDISWGLRAMAKDLSTKIKNGYNTIELIIFRYAPPNVDNNHTLNYIASVVRDTGWRQNLVLDSDADTLQSLMRGMINFELGRSYSDMLSDADIADGIDMAKGGGGSSAVGPVGFGVSMALFIFVVWLLITMPKQTR